MKDTNIRQTITRNLNELMEKNRIRAIDLAEAVGVSKSAVSHWLPNNADLNTVIFFFDKVIALVVQLQKFPR